MTERRTARRYDLSLPIIIRVSVETERPLRTGKTRDVSTHGVYFTIDGDLSLGAELDLTMILPAELTGGSEVFIRSVGKIVRVDKRSTYGEQPIGVAAVIKRYEVIRRNEAAIA